MPTQWRTIAPIVGRTASQCLEHYNKLLYGNAHHKPSTPNLAIIHITHTFTTYACHHHFHLVPPYKSLAGHHRIVSHCVLCVCWVLRGDQRNQGSHPHSTSITIKPPNSWHTHLLLHIVAACSWTYLINLVVMLHKKRTKVTTQQTTQGGCVLEKSILIQKQSPLAQIPWIWMKMVCRSSFPSHLRRRHPPFLIQYLYFHRKGNAFWGQSSSR